MREKGFFVDQTGFTREGEPSTADPLNRTLVGTRHCGLGQPAQRGRKKTITVKTSLAFFFAEPLRNAYQCKNKPASPHTQCYHRSALLNLEEEFTPAIT